ncbi:MAG: hypothetical protein LBF86_07175 [Helicobacteraceae bacterium]|jgi:hypothetical protein|nr:hypothetical protein [Helicobacteraceae bacterium]
MKALKITILLFISLFMCVCAYAGDREDAVAALAEAVQKGHIRKATDKELNDSIKDKRYLRHIRDPYILLSDEFVFFPLYGANSIVLITPDNMSMPAGDWGHSSVIYKNEVFGTIPKFTPIPPCSLPKFNIPKNATVYAVGSGGKELLMQIDDSGKNAGSVEISVNLPDETVILLLGAYQPTIWHLSWTNKTKIAAVLFSGYHKQIVTGIDTDRVYLSQCNFRYIESAAEYALNEFSLATFKKPISAFIYSQNGYANIGGISSKLITYEKFKPEKYATTKLHGQLAIAEAVKKGQLKVATAEDCKKATTNSGCDRFRNGYILIDPEFEFPNGLTGAHSITLIIPYGMSVPKGDRGHSDIIIIEKPLESDKM